MNEDLGNYSHQFSQLQFTSSTNNNNNNDSSEITPIDVEEKNLFITENTQLIPPIINTNVYSLNSRLTRRPTSLHLRSSVINNSLLYSMNTSGLSIRRASDSHPYLNNEITDYDRNSCLITKVCDSRVQVSLYEKEKEKRAFIASAVEKLYQTTSETSVINLSSQTRKVYTSKNFKDNLLSIEKNKNFTTNSTKVIDDKKNLKDSFINNNHNTKKKDILSLRDVLYSDFTSEDSYLEKESVNRNVKFSKKSIEKPMFLRNYNRGIFGLFGSIGRDHFETFSDIFTKYQVLLEPFLERVLQLNHKLYPKEINLIEFLRKPEEAPDDNFFRSPLLSWPLHVIYATSCFYLTTKFYGYDETFEAIRLQGGLFSSGKDIFAALAVAMSPTEEALIYHTSRMFRAAFFVGMIFTESEDYLQTHVQNCSRRSFSLLLINISTSMLKLFIDEINKIIIGPNNNNNNNINNNKFYSENKTNTIPMSRVEISRVISSRSAVVCGHPMDLERLSILIVTYCSATGAKIYRNYLPSTSPENSSFYNQSKHLQLIQVWGENNVHMNVSELYLTVYSPVDGKPWRNTSNFTLIDQVALAVTCSSHDLTYSLQNLHEGDVLIDFTSSVPCIGHLMYFNNKEITVLSEPDDKIRISVIPSPRRSAADGIYHSTLEKCAKINNILQNMQWKGKPNQAFVESLSTSFIDISLLIKVEDFTNNSNFIEFQKNNFSLIPSSINENFFFDFSVKDYSKSYEKSKSTILSEDNNSSTDVSTVFHYILFSNDKVPILMNMYQISPLIKYYEMQFKCILTQGAVKFAQELSDCTGLAFPPHTLLMCPTVLALMELWDTYEFFKLQKL